MRLYIIGNGFDLHHRMPTSYWQFKAYLEENDPETYELVQQYLDHNGELWQDFENNLAEVDEETIMENAKEHHHGYGEDDWSDAYHYSYQDSISEIVDPLLDGLRENFVKWICQISLPKITGRVDLDPNALYLSFNYTDTLEKLYKIEPSQVLHIHGKASSKNPELIFGHSYVKPADGPDFDRLRGELSEEDFNEFMDDYHSGIDPRTSEGENIMRSYYELTYKPTTEIIQTHSSFFYSLTEVDEVYILGLSLSDVDMPYIRKIQTSIKPDATWYISAYGSEEKERFPAILKSIGITKVKLYDLDPIAGMDQLLFN